MNARLVLCQNARAIVRLLVRLLACLLVGLHSTSALAKPPAVDVSVERVDSDSGRVYQVSARGEVAANPAAVWRILTDYDRMAEFVPDLHSTRVLERRGDQAIVEQRGVAHFLFFRREIRLLVQVREQPMSQIDISLVDGDMTVYNCVWRLVPVPETGGTRVVYSGVLAPKFYVPAMLGANLIRADLARMMAAVLARLDRPD
jgi:ribosome-associated toxin RatA of RatAB toxin-antitoxin module